MAYSVTEDRCKDFTLDRLVDNKSAVCAGRVPPFDDFPPQFKTIALIVYLEGQSCISISLAFPKEEISLQNICKKYVIGIIHLYIFTSKAETGRTQLLLF